MKNKFKVLTTRILTFFLSIFTFFAMVPLFLSNVYAETLYTGGLGIANEAQTVWETTNGTGKVGTIYKNEGFTILYTNNNVMRVQYSSPNSTTGMKEGYIVNPNVTSLVDGTSVGKVNYGTSVYFGPNTGTYERAGSVNSGEYVVVLERSNGWAFIEYNTKADGRKRGYINDSNLTIYYPSRLSSLNIYNRNSINKVSVNSKRDIYQGPTSTYNINGSVSASDGYMQYFWWGGFNGEAYWYVEYSLSNGKLKTGYLRDNSW